MGDLIERLRDGLTLYSLNAEAADRIEELEAENERLQAKVEALEGAIRWALGESPEGMPEFPLIGEPPYYRWRTQLRLLADLPYIAATEQEDDRVWRDGG